MIIPMKKIAVIMQAKDAHQAVKILRSLGILHVEHQQAHIGKDIRLLQDDLTLINQALEIISEEEFVEKCKAEDIEKRLPDWKSTARHIVELWKRLDHLREYSKALAQQLNEWRMWGDFDSQDILSLAQKNIQVKLLRIPQKEMSKLPQGVIIEKIAQEAGSVYCAVITQEKIDLPFKELEPPRMRLSEMKRRLSEDKKIIEETLGQLNSFLCHKNRLIEIKRSLEKEIEFNEALSGMGRSQTLTYLVGYAPAEIQGELENLAKKEKWGILVTEPSAEDNVPVLLRNPKWVSIINPIFKLMNVVPGYREFDVSLLFLLFLSLFFGMIIGDAGYGAVYFLLTFFAQRKFGGKVKDKSVFFLFYLFSFCAIVWGLLTGTLFGQFWYQSQGFKAFAPILNEAKFLMSFCFFLGALQLSLAHGWQAIIKFPSLKALADVGFICLLWVGFFLAKMFIVGDPFPFFGKWLIWAGVLLIIFFTNPQKNIFKGTLKGVGVLALGLMGNFGDVVSYIRLFAVGLAGVAVADSVNSFAASVGGNIAAQIIILFIGHSINIILGPISVLIHGVRLNVLEFSLLHGSITWSGLAYRPLKS